MANKGDIYKVALPNGDEYNFKDKYVRENYRALNNNDFDTINVTELNSGNIINTGAARFLNTINGSISGNAATASDSAKLNGYASDTSATNNTIARRTANGYIFATYFNQSSSAETPTSSSYVIYANSDGYFRKSSIANMKTAMSLNNVENKSSATIRGELTSANVTTALGYTPVNKAGDTMTGELINQKGGIWVQGGSAAGGDVDRMTLTGGMPTELKYNGGKRGLRLYSNAVAMADPYNGNSNSDAGWIRHIEETSNSSIFEIAVGDDGNESIVMRQYNTSSAVAREAKILGADGATSFPVSVTAPKFIGNLQGNADTATKATQDESGNNIKASYASSFSISDHTITLKNKNGVSLGTVTVPDNNTTYGLSATNDNITLTAGGTGTTVKAHLCYNIAIDNSTDWNTFQNAGAYKVQMASWGDADTYHSPNKYKSDLYSFGMLYVVKSGVGAENRVFQYYIPHSTTMPLLVRSHNHSSSWDAGWSAWYPIWVGIGKSDVGLGNVENKSSATIRSEITSSNVTTALGYTPANKAGDTFTGRVAYKNVSMPLSAGKVTSLVAGTTEIFKDGIAISNPATANDVGWIRVTGTGEADTVLEIATGDDGGMANAETIAVRQYNTSNNIAKEAILLNPSGNTSFPGSVTGTGGFIGNLTGNADTATSATKATQDGDGNAINTTYLKKSGGTMTGQIKTSFKSAIAIGSRLSDATTIPDLCADVRYSSGCCGSVSISTAYTLSGSGVTIGTGWYNYMWIPHRSGGVNGAASGDNCNYGSLYLSGMTMSGLYMVRFASGAIAEVKNLYKDDNTTYGLGTSGNNITIVAGGTTTSVTAPYATSAGSATKATQDGSGNTITSTYVKKSGDTMTGHLCISDKSGSYSWNEGIRINKAGNNYSSLVMGGTPDSTSGTGDGIWWIGCNMPSLGRKLYFAHNGSTQSSTYFYADSSSQQSPNLRVGGTLGVGNAGATKTCQMKYNENTDSLDFVFVA